MVLPAHAGEKQAHSRWRRRHVEAADRYPPTRHGVRIASHRLFVVAVVRGGRKGGNWPRKGESALGKENRPSEKRVTSREEREIPPSPFDHLIPSGVLEIQSIEMIPFFWQQWQRVHRTI